MLTGLLQKLKEKKTGKVGGCGVGGGDKAFNVLASSGYQIAAVL